ncbi:MAG TPA: hypothetical protein VJ249_11080 [Candidatus Bathyarchaeia archaeon]|nr:hypothetical protein [Candidatus Bathyarchaeia archaeon]
MFPFLPDTGMRQSGQEIEETLGPSLLWYLVPFFFGILGGIVAYVAVKDRDEGMAFGLLVFGLIWTVVEVILYYAAVAYYLNILF